jgi:hypothetical protein|tara:strand:- start:841 stop:1119 length:279 start_codon:yes stop_codon:yes gene_type:complete
MCNCNAKSVDSPHLKIYTVMSEYKAKKSVGTLYKGGFKINWASASQEELAYAYEELGMTSLIEKTSNIKTKDEPKKTTKKKKSGKESSDSKE